MKHYKLFTRLCGPTIPN